MINYYDSNENGGEREARASERAKESMKLAAHLYIYFGYRRRGKRKRTAIMLSVCVCLFASTLISVDFIFLVRLQFGSHAALHDRN